MLSAERAADLQREGLRNASSASTWSSARWIWGSGTRLDLVRAQQDTRLARADVLTGREQAMQARETLGALAGQRSTPGGGSPIWTWRRSWRPPAGRAARWWWSSGPTWPLPGCDCRPPRAVAEARAEYLPSLTLQSAATAQTVEPGPVRVPSWTVSAVLSVPL